MRYNIHETQTEDILSAIRKNYCYHNNACANDQGMCFGFIHLNFFNIFFLIFARQPSYEHIYCTSK